MTYNKEELREVFKNAPLKIGNDFYEDLNDDLFDSLNCASGDYYYSHGASKLAIISVNGDYVIKIPYTGELSEDIWYPTEEEFQEFFDPYCNAGGDCPWDYCALEVERYEYAKQFGFEKYLAKIELLGYLNGYPIYIQEKCETYYDSVRSKHYTEEEKKTTRSICGLGKFDYLTNENWLTDFRFYYGNQALTDFSNFLTKNGWDDLNDSNIGYLNNRPIIFDFSGFEG